MTGTPLGARRIDLGLYFFRSRRGLVQGIQLLEGIPEALGSGTARALLACPKEIHEVFDLCTLLRGQGLQFLNKGLDGLSVHCVTPIARGQSGSVSWLEQAELAD
jgi:hypothetical protein